MIEIKPDTPKVEFTVAGVLLQCFAPFKEGDVLEANEAHALNQTHRENVRNNNAPDVKKILEEAKAVDEKGNIISEKITDKVMGQCQKLIDDVVKGVGDAPGYQFGVRTGGTRTPKDEALAMALGMARDKILEKSRAEGKPASAWDKDELRTECERVVNKNAKLLAHCRKIIDDRDSANIDL